MSDRASPVKKRDLETAHRVHAAAIHLLRSLRKVDRRWDVSAAKLSALSVLAFHGPLTLGELAQAEQVTPPTISKLVAALEREGWVRRKSDAADRRVVTVAVTAKGRRLLERARDARVAELARRLAGLRPDDRRILKRASEQMERLAGKD